MAFWVLVTAVWVAARVDCRPVAEPVDTTSLGSEAFSPLEILAKAVEAWA